MRTHIKLSLILLFVSSFVHAAYFDNIGLNGNTVSTTNSNGNLIFDLDGTGKIQFADQTASRVPYLDSSKNLTSSVVTPTELEFLGGVLSSLCGIADSCILTNKTLTAPAIDGANLEFGTATNSNRIRLPSDTTSNLDALTDVAGLLAYDTTQSKPVYNNGSGWTAVGSGSGSGFFNLISAYNWDFEKSAGATTDWTASGGTFSAATSTNILDGLQSVTWDSNASSQTLSSTAVTVPYGMSGRNGWAQCKILTPSGIATHKIQVYDGTNVIKEQTITSSTIADFSGTSFIWPSTGTLRIRLISVASNEPLISVDSCSIGDMDEQKITNISQAQFIGSAYFETTTNCAGWSRTNTALGAFASDSDCPAVTVDENPGPAIIQTTDYDLPKFGINNMPPGIYVIYTNITLSKGGSSTATFTLNDGTTSKGRVSTQGSGGESDGLTLVSVFRYDQPGNRAFEIYGSSSTGAISIGNDANNIRTGFTVVRFPLTSEQGFRADQLAQSWSGYHDNTCSWARTNTAYGDPTADASCNLVQRVNNNFGTVTSSGSVLPNIVFTPKVAGATYWVCAAPKFAIATNSTDGDARLWDGTTVIAEDQARGEGDASSKHPIRLCGLYTGPQNLNAITLSLQTKAASGAVTLASSSTNASAVEWSIVAVNQPFPQPLIKGAVVTSSSGVEGIESATLNCDSSSAITSQAGDWISSIGNLSGSCAITIKPGVFSAAPRCWTQINSKTCAAGSGAVAFVTVSSATSVNINTIVSTSDSGCTVLNFDFFCKGPK